MRFFRSYDAMIINLQKENSKCSNCAVYHRHCSYCEEEAGASGIHLIKVRSYLVCSYCFFPLRTLK